jgi:UDP-N-acetylmuramoyl-L-alanyl-D-glutamate--2,6-diaminopimelate ligase
VSAVRRRLGEPHLGELLAGLAALPPVHDRPVSGLASDSRAVAVGDVFFACRGVRTSGEQHVDEALAAGAVAIVRAGVPGVAALANGTPVITVADLGACMGAVAHRFYGEPSAGLRVVGVTGTNGKTSVAQFLAGALSAAGPGEGYAACGVIGTLGYGLYGDVHAGLHTTPEVLSSHRLLAEMRAAGARHAVMEVSSHGLDQGRVAGVRFDTAVFTNLTRDHLDYHPDMTAYGAAKRRLFECPGLRAAVLNRDDPFGRELAAALSGTPRIITYGLDEGAGGAHPHLAGRLLEATPGGLVLEVRGPWGEQRLSAPLVGAFNAANLLAALAALVALDIPFEQAVAVLARAVPVPGRMQPLGGGARPLVVVDYAHTPEALRSALRAVRAHCRGRLWCVFGCGGERDRGKRPLMGAIAAAEADSLVLTDDNPRGEDGTRIIQDILGGLPAGTVVTVQRERAAAIRHAVNVAVADDVILVAGKGHEPYQEAAGVRRPFSDAAAAAAALEDTAP